MKNYYEILEVSQKASPEVIEKAYKALVKKYHPDLQPDPTRKKESEMKLKEINEAYEILSDEVKKSSYDSEISRLNNNNVASVQQTYKNSNTTNNNSNLSHYTKSNVSNNNYTRSNNSSINKQPFSRQNQNTSNNTYSQNQTYIDPDQLQREYERAFNRAYINTLKNMGYQIRYEKTFKDYLKQAFVIIMTILFLVILSAILWHIPYTKIKLINLYNDNFIVKLFVDIIYQVFSNLISLIIH